MHGVMMSPESRRSRTAEYPPIAPRSADGDGGDDGGNKKGQQPEPLPVILARGTFLKFALLILGSLLVSISAILAFYWKHHFEVRTHMENKTIHLDSGERAKLETKAEAASARKEIVHTITAHVDLKMGQLRVDQKEQIQKLSTELKAAQCLELREVLSEVKRTRRDLNASPAHSP